MQGLSAIHKIDNNGPSAEHLEHHTQPLYTMQLFQNISPSNVYHDSVLNKDMLREQGDVKYVGV